MQKQWFITPATNGVSVRGEESLCEAHPVIRVPTSERPLLNPTDGRIFHTKANVQDLIQKDSAGGQAAKDKTAPYSGLVPVDRSYTCVTLPVIQGSYMTCAEQRQSSSLCSLYRKTWRQKDSGVTTREDVNKHPIAKVHMAILPPKGQIKVTALAQEMENPSLFDPSIDKQANVKRKLDRKIRPRTGSACLIQRPDILRHFKHGEELLTQEKDVQNKTREMAGNLTACTIRELTSFLNFTKLGDPRPDLRWTQTAKTPQRCHSDPGFDENSGIHGRQL